jgi:serine protease AprX
MDRAPVRRMRNRVLAGAAVLATFCALPVSAAHAAITWRSVIVTGQPGALSVVTHAVTQAGGKVTKTLGVVNGVSARVPATSIGELRATPGVRSVTPDATGHLMGIDPVLGYDVQNDEGSLFDVATITHAKDAWSHGYTGKGVGVALIDSGVSPVKGLTSGNVVNGPDISFDSQNPNLTNLDGYGHGTHMASIIAGRDTPSSGSTYANPGSHQFVGIAPDSTVVSVKVGAADGAVDVSQVIAAIDWVTQHANSGNFNIRVLNLSYGTDSTQSPSVDPLDFAVENAWKAGIVVVAAAGNGGSTSGTLSDPANDPLVVAVGADDPENTNSVGDDQIASFSQVGPANGRHIDVLAPGVHTIGLRDPGSFIDQANPSAVLNSRFFRGSGTSQATAVVSGLAADYLSKYPSASPDQVKYALTTYDQVPNQVKSAGSTVGVPDINKATSSALPSATTAKQAPTTDTGTGSLEAARGSFHVNDGTNTLTGEQDIFGAAWNGNSWALASAAGNSWAGGTWNGNSWAGNSWAGSSWAGSTWAGCSWASNDWAGNSWAGNTWAGNSWANGSWNGNSWAGNSWAGNSWAGNSWAGSTWASSSWADASWS